MMAIDFGVQSAFSFEAPNFGLAESIAYKLEELLKLGQDLCEYLGVYLAFKSTVAIDQPASHSA